MRVCLRMNFRNITVFEFLKKLIKIQVEPIFYGNWHLCQTCWKLILYWISFALYFYSTWSIQLVRLCKARALIYDCVTSPVLYTCPCLSPSFKQRSSFFSLLRTLYLSALAKVIPSPDFISNQVRLYWHDGKWTQLAKGNERACFYTHS